MPITKSAKKKLKQDKKKTLINKGYRVKLKKAVKTARQKPSQKTISLAYKALDKAAKKKIVHQGKADRLKSRLMKLKPKVKKSKAKQK